MKMGIYKKLNGNWGIVTADGKTFGNFATPTDARRHISLNGCDAYIGERHEGRVIESAEAAKKLRGFVYEIAELSGIKNCKTKILELKRKAQRLLSELKGGAK